MSASTSKLGYLFVGSIAFMLLCALTAGICLSVWGARETANGIFSRGWPTIEGNIVSVSLVEDLNNEDSSLPVWKVRLVYGYEVDGQHFTGTRQSYDGGSAAGYDGDRHAVDKYLEKHKQGQRILIRYNPRHPAKSVLEPGFQIQGLFLFACGVVMFLGSSTLIIGILRLRK